MLAVEAVLALDDAGVGAVAELLGSLTKGESHVEVGNGGELDGGILKRGVLKANGTSGNDDVAGLDGKVDAAAGAGADKGVRAELVQLFHGDGGRGAADAGGADGDLFAEKRAGIRGVFAVARDEMRIIEKGSDGGAAAGVAGHDHIAADLTLGAVDMIKTFQFMHDKCAPFL